MRNRKRFICRRCRETGRAEYMDLLFSRSSKSEAIIRHYRKLHLEWEYAWGYKEYQANMYVGLGFPFREEIKESEWIKRESF